MNIVLLHVTLLLYKLIVTISDTTQHMIDFDLLKKNRMWNSLCHWLSLFDFMGAANQAKYNNSIVNLS